MKRQVYNYGTHYVKLRIERKQLCYVRKTLYRNATYSFMELNISTE